MMIRLPRPVEDFILRRPLLIGIMIALVFGLVSISFWNAHSRYNQIQDEIEENDRRLTAVTELQMVAGQIRERLTAAFALNRSRLMLLADLAASESRSKRAEFNRRAQQMVSGEDGLYESISLVDTSWSRKVVFPEDRGKELLDGKIPPTPAHEKIMGSPLRDTARSILSPLGKLPDGSTGFALDVPVYDRATLIGFISARIRLAPFLEEALGSIDKTYGLRISQEDGARHANRVAARSTRSFNRILNYSPADGQEWIIDISIPDAHERPFHAGNAYDLGILITGMCVALFVALLVYRLIVLLDKSRQQEQERSQLLTRIQRSERELFSFIDSANVILIVVDELGMVTLSNYTMQKYTGYTPDDLKGKIWWKVFRISGEQTAIIEQVFAGRKSVENLETPVITATGQTRYVIWNIGPSTTDQGFRFVCVGRDVTERRMNAAALRLTEERFQILFEEMKEGVIATDTGGFITQINSAAREILRLPKGKIEGRSLRDVFPGVIDESGAALSSEQFAPLVALREQHSYYGFVAGLPGTDDPGAVIWIYGSCGVINVSGEFLGLIVTFSDITGIKNAEAQINRSRESLRQIILNMQIGVALCDSRDRVEVYNPQFRNMWGLPESWLDAKPDFREVAERIAAPFMRTNPISARLDEALAKTGTEQFELQIHDQFHVEFFTARLADGSRLWTFRDVSQARLLEKQLRQAQKMESVGQLAGGLAHDFNNILTVVNGYLALALEQTDRKDRRHTQMVRMQEALTRATGITRKLLTFSRGDVFRKEIISLNDTIRDSVDLLSRSVPGNIKIQYSLTAGDKKIFADRGAIDQILVNGCLNAVDAMPRGGTIQISTDFRPRLGDAVAMKMPHPNPHGYIRWTIKDTGGGIPPEIMGRIFEPFFTTKQNKSGTGLGLAMVYGICRSHGGHVEVDSTLGKGTELTIYLPVTVERSYEEHSGLVDMVSDYSILKDRTILLVDDEDMVLEMASDLLEDRGIIVYQAFGPREALELFDKAGGRIDLVVTDMVMPEMSGLELVDAIRRRDPEMDFIVTSGYTLREQKEELESRGIRSFLLKPYSPDQLFKLLHNHFSNRHRARGGTSS